MVKMKENPKSQKKTPKRKVSLELFHHGLGNRSTRSILDGDTENAWQDIELRVHHDSYCTLCQIYTRNKKDRSKLLINTKTH